ncbi:STAS/SEC14 domain-containing protein [bacterium]|nr:STAS/SEC14 domain-containing protein [bacterium]
MLTMSEANDNHVVIMHVSDRLTKSDIEKALPELDKQLATHDKLRFFIKLEDVTGIDLEALWEDLKYDARHGHQYGKTAIVGDRRWEELATRISNLIFSAPVKFFNKTHEEQAWQWIVE